MNGAVGIIENSGIKVRQINCRMCGILCSRKKPCKANRLNWKFCGAICKAKYVMSIRPRKGIDGMRECLYCKTDFPVRLSAKVRSVNGIGSAKQRYCSIKCALIDRNKSEKHRTLIGNQRRGENCIFWKGGVSNANKRFRETGEYKRWRQSVYKRDNYRCYDCGLRNEKGSYIKLQAHHIFNFAIYPRLRLMLENGMTLCIDCHKKTPDYLRHYPKSAYNL